MNLDKFDWGTSSEWFVETIKKEIFIEKIYEKFFEVEEDDVVFDIGASIGPFTYSILEKKPKKVICFEPSFEEFSTLVKNTLHGNVYCINKGISSFDGEQLFNDLYGQTNAEGLAYGVTFNQIIEDFNLNKINFIKTDCEGGEYDIFNIENLFWIKNNVEKIVGEWHLDTVQKKEKFRVFRDVYLRVFSNHEIYSIDNVNIKWDLWNEHFIEYYNHVIIYINNKI
jgi:FkbM family methyltransferase